MKKFLIVFFTIFGVFILYNPIYAKTGVPEREYKIAVVLFNEAEYESAEEKFGVVIEQGDLSIPEAAPYVINSYYGRASCRIEQGRKLKLDGKLKDAMDKYESAYDDLSVFKAKFEEFQSKLKSSSLYEEMEKHFIIISDQMVQLAGEAGDIAFNQGNYEKALIWYDKGLQFTSPRSNVYGNLIYAKADAVFQLGRYQEALRLLTKFEDELSSHNLKSKALFYAGDIYKIMAEVSSNPMEKQNYLQKACEVYEQVINSEIDITNLELIKNALLEKGRCEKQLGRMEQAMADFRSIIANYPNTRHSVDAELEIGDYSFTAKQYTKAIQSFEKAVDVARSLNLPELMAIGYYWLGWSYFSEASSIDTETSPEMIKRNKNLYEKSIEAFQNSNKNVEKFWKKEGKEVQMAKELDGYYGESIYMIGRCNQRLGKWSDAIKTFETISPAYQKWRLKGLAEIAVSKERLGDVKGSMDKWDELKRELSLTRIPDIELDLLLRRADSIFDLQRYDEAEKAYREIISKYPNSSDIPKVKVNLGLSLFKQNRNKEAIQEFTSMLEKYGKDDTYSLSIGDALFWKGYLTARIGTNDNEIKANLNQSIKDYKELVSRFPDNFRADDAQFEIGFCTYSLGAYDEKKYTEAIGEYTKVLQNYPESEYADDALFEIGRCYRLIGDENNEEKALRLMAENYPTSELADNAILRIAEIYFDRAQKSKSISDRQKAESAYNEIITKYPGTESEAIAHFQMGSIYYKLDNSFQRSASSFAKSVEVIDKLLNKVLTGAYVPADLDVAVIANLLLRANFWQAESMFQLAKQSEQQAQPPAVTKQAYAQARSTYQQLLNRGTKLRNDFPQKTDNLYNVMDGSKLDIPIIGETQFMISRCFYKEGDFDNAMSSLKDIKGPEKLTLKADYLRAMIAYDQGKLIEAKSMAEAWLNNDNIKDLADEYSVDMQLLLAKIDLTAGNINQARSKALDIWALYQSINGLWEEAAYVVARCYQQQKDLERAKSWYNRLQGSQFLQWRTLAQNAIAQLGN